MASSAADVHWRALGKSFALRQHPTAKHPSCHKEAHGRQQKRRHFVDADANGEERGSPYQIDDRERQYGFPRRGMDVGVHSRIITVTLTATHRKKPVRSTLECGGSTPPSTNLRTPISPSIRSYGIAGRNEKAASSRRTPRCFAHHDATFTRFFKRWCPSAELNSSAASPSST